MCVCERGEMKKRQFEEHSVKAYVYERDRVIGSVREIVCMREKVAQREIHNV